MRQRRSGFTLIEILIALAIFAVVIAQAFAVFGAQHVTYTGTERSIEVQQDVRLVADAILSDVRMAGYMVSRSAGIASVDGGNANADLLCVSDPSVISDVEVDDATARFDQARVAISAVSGGDKNVSVSTLNNDGDNPPTTDFTVDSGVIISDGTSSHCAYVRTIGGNNLVFLPVTPAGFAAGVGTGYVVTAVIYEITGTNELRRNTLRLSNQVEDLQVEFGIDGDGDGQIVPAEFLNVLNGQDPLDLLAVRLSVIARADSEDEALQTSGRPAAANRVAGGSDGFRRRKIIARIVPRNLL
jgi:prepilin-type N-terminal cleavage/methylation domain-containing protein